MLYSFLWQSMKKMRITHKRNWYIGTYVVTACRLSSSCQEKTPFCCLPISEAQISLWIHIWGSRGGTVGRDPPRKITKNIGFHCNTGPDPLKYHKATKPAFNVGPSSAHPAKHRLNGVCWRADDGQYIAVSGSSIPSPTAKKRKKMLSNLDPLRQNFLDPRMICTAPSAPLLFTHWNIE